VQAVRDFSKLIIQAFFGGIGVAVAMSLAILLLSANSQAATINDAKAGTLLIKDSSVDGGYA